jgi:hypothetical protein
MGLPVKAAIMLGLSTLPPHLLEGNLANRPKKGVAIEAAVKSLEHTSKKRRQKLADIQESINTLTGYEDDDNQDLPPRLVIFSVFRHVSVLFGRPQCCVQACNVL